MGVPAVPPKAEASGQKRKRKNEATGAPIRVELPSFGPLGMEMHSDEENAAVGSGDEESESDHESFPELDTRGDSEDETSDEGNDPEEHDGSSSSSYLLEDSEDEVDVSQDDAVKIGPQATTIVSKITGRPKRVYPEIVPDYDSDSSTEDVCSSANYIPCS
jgi:ribosome biogenesis protein ERB1